MALRNHCYRILVVSLLDSPIVSARPVPARQIKPEQCELCNRKKPLSFHHLIPRKNHRRNYFKRTFDKWDMVTRGAWLCRLCHKKLHKTYSEQELGKHLNTLETIKAQPEMQVFLEWAKKQK